MTYWKKYIVGCAVGNILEWYDFILYGFFAPVFANLFFPAESNFVSLLLTFAVFASGCLVRPISGIIFGHIGDRFGRKQALVFSIILITISTTLMGLLPTYGMAGVAAPLLLVICRLVQGVAVSGEEVGAAILLAESAPQRQQTLMGSIILSSVYLGLFFGAVTALVVFYFSSPHFLQSWGWRIPFLGASLLGLFALKIRLSSFDSRAYINIQHQERVLQHPLNVMLKTHWQPFLRAIGISAVLAVAIYTFAVYLPSYYTKIAGFGVVSSLSISAFFLFIISIVVPIIGYMGDRYGAKNFMIFGCVGLALTSYLIFWLLAQHVLWMAMLAQATLMFFLAFIAGSILSILIGMFPVNIRYSGVCISFNISMTLFGSTAPIIALTLQTYFNNPIAPCVYLAGAALVTILSLSIDGFGLWRWLGFRRNELAQENIVEAS